MRSCIINNYKSIEINIKLIAYQVATLNDYIRLLDIYTIYCIKTKKMLKKAGISHIAKQLDSSSKILMRADFNVPLKNGKIVDPNRITSTIPTIQNLLKYNPKSLVLLSHLGRPNGEDKKLSLRPVVEALSGYLDRPVTFLQSCVGDQILEKVRKADNEIFLCENIRFHIEQTGSVKDSAGKKIKASEQAIKKFRNQISQLGEIFVNDAFGSAHRAHSSVVGINHKYRVAGNLMKRQIDFLGGFLEAPKKPTLVILGGAKVADKIKLIKNMINFADQIFIGGGMKNPFLSEIYGLNLGSTKIVMPENPSQLKEIMQLAKKKGCKIHFPIDYRAGKEMKAGTEVKIFSEKDSIPQGWQIFDMGPQSAKQFDQIVKRANSIFWNGPVGVIELEQFKVGSVDILNSMIKRTKEGGTSIIGGGDSASLVNNLKLQKELSYVSTGGGATLELLEGKMLPGIDSLSNIDEIK